MMFCELKTHYSPHLIYLLFQVEVFAVGDFVRVLSDLKAVKRLQVGHGEWKDDMKEVRH